MTAPPTTAAGVLPLDQEENLQALILPLLDGAFGTAVHLTRNRPDAEDILQETVQLACRGFGTYQRGTDFKAWFFRILTNCFYSKRRQARRDGVQMELDDNSDLFLYCQTAALGLHARTDDPANLLMEQIDSEQVTAAMEALPDEYRVVATLSLLQEFTYQEIAAVLDIPVGTVRSRMHRARRMLQRALWTVAKDHGIISTLCSPVPDEA